MIVSDFDTFYETVNNAYLSKRCINMGGWLSGRCYDIQTVLSV